MKKKYLLAGLIASIVASAFIATVAATDYFPTLITTRKGKILTWHIDTTSDLTNGPFSGLDVNEATLVAKWWDDLANVNTVTPYDVVLAENYVELYFYKQDLPKSASYNSVAGSLNNGVDTFLASGPGWAFANIH